MPKNITVSISDNLGEEMDKLKDVNWSEVCEMAIEHAIKNEIILAMQVEEVLRLRAESQKG